MEIENYFSAKEISYVLRPQGVFNEVNNGSLSPSANLKRHFG